MPTNDGTRTDLAYADTLWKAADSLRGQVDAAEYKHVVLGLLFLKYISDSFEARRDELKGELEADGIAGPQVESLASAEGKNGGQFYTPRCVVRMLVEMLAPDKGRVYDLCCGSAGMFVQSEKFVEEHGGRIGDIAGDGQESNSTTRRLAMMNLTCAAPKETSAPCGPSSWKRRSRRI